MKEREKWLCFRVPANKEMQARVIEAIPQDWAWLEGLLGAPNHLISSGRALPDTELEMSQFDCINPLVVGSYYKDSGEVKREKPDLFGIFVEQKLPSLVSFRGAGNLSSFITLEVAKKLAIGFLLKGYGGRLSFYQRVDGSCASKESIHCEMILGPRTGSSVKDEGLKIQIGKVKIVYSQDLDDVRSLERAFESIGLEKHIPTLSDPILY